MLTRQSLEAIRYEDIEALTASGEAENVSLDYKQEITGSDHDKAELAKDVSAMANSQGGDLVIGVAEEHGKPVHPPCGTGALIGRQKVEDWIEQTINQNVEQRVELGIRALKLPATDKRIVVVRVPMSPRMPHMVTYKQDNRYYRRYFKRHEFQSLPAEEYEVREMFEKSTRLRSRVLEYLEHQGYGNPDSDGFASNRFTAKLGMIHHEAEKHLVVQATNFVTFVAFPDLLEEDILPIADETMWKWLEPNARRYEPATRANFLPTDKRMILDGILLSETLSREPNSPVRLEKSLRIQRNGFVEYAWAPAVKHNRETVFPFCAIMGILWMFLGFLNDLYVQFAPDVRLTLMVNMKGTTDALLGNLGEGWREPLRSDDIDDYIPRCLEPNIQVVRILGVPSAIREPIQETLRSVAVDIDNAWGQREPRCYNRQQWDPEQKLNVSSLRYIL